MKRLLIVAAIALIVAPVLAGPGVLPERGTKYATYDMATGTLIPGQTRMGDSIWAATTRSGYYWPQLAGPPYAPDLGAGITSLEWGDIVTTPGVGVDVGGFAFSYATDDLVLPDTVDVLIGFYGEENGWDGDGSIGRTWLALYQIADLPTSDPGGTFNGWTVTVDLEAPGNPGCFNLIGSDMDASAYPGTDFGYSYWFLNYGPPGYPLLLGPTIAGDANSPGAENAFDLFSDPNLTTYYDTVWFGGDPFAQFYMELFACEANQPTTDCPNPGKPTPRDWYCTADVAGTGGQDCVVGLADLAALLANYGTTTGATHLQGDVEPEDHDGRWEATDGDGDVDLSDLAQLLGQYTDNCN